jgi:uncharacterized small protein (DUF1192 family)
MTSVMATTNTRAKSQKDFVGRLADAGEEALQKLTELPGGQRVASAMNDLRARVDDLSRKVRGIDELQTRVAKLEREVAALKKSRSTTKASSSDKPSSPS